MKNIFPFTLGAITLFAVLFLNGCTRSTSYVSCDCETGENSCFKGKTDSTRFLKTCFKNTDCRTDVRARSGRYSIKLSKNCSYGLTYTIDDARSKEHFSLSVWRYKSGNGGCLVASADSVEDFYLVQYKSAGNEDGDWERLGFDFNVPESADGKNINIYTWNEEESPVFFDDLSIEYIKDKPPPSPEKSFLTDMRDGQKYEIVRIGNDQWMAENLNFKANDHAICYEDNDRFCEIFGRLYDFNTAKTACPSGWKLPTDDEWKELERNIGMDPEEVEKYGNRGNEESILLRENGSSGFNVKLAGTCSEGFYDLYKAGYFWTSTQTDANHAWCRAISCRVDIGRFRDAKKMHFSVRCIKER